MAVGHIATMLVPITNGVDLTQVSSDACIAATERGWNGGDFDMNVMINNSLQFGLAQDFTAKTLEEVVGRYVRLGLITNMDDVAEIMSLAWSSVLD